MNRLNTRSIVCTIFFIIFSKSTVALFPDEHVRPKLEIWPLASKKSIELGSKVVLTCRIAEGTSMTEMRDLYWLDPQNRTIDNNNLLFKNRMTIMHMHAKKSLLLMFKYLNVDERGQYTCVGTHRSADQYATSIFIEVIEPISWAHAPTAQSLMKGKKGKIKCQVAADPSPIVNWILNNEAIRSGDRYGIESDGLTIDNVQASDAGSYTCRAIVPQTGEFAERVIEVGVQSVSAKNDSLISRTITAEEKTSGITCGTCTMPPPIFTYIEKSTKQSKGNIRNRFTVDAPTLQYLIRGTKGKIKCKVNGNFRPIVNWIRNNEIIPSGHRYLVGSDGLIISNVEDSDGGRYTCRVVVNNIKQLSESAITVEVQSSPVIHGTMISEITVKEKESISIQCKAFGRPPPIYSWIKESEGQIVSEESGRLIVNKQTGVLTIDNVLKEDDGEFRCLATNSVGNDEKIVKIIVILKTINHRTEKGILIIASKNRAKRYYSIGVVILVLIAMCVSYYKCCCIIKKQIHAKRIDEMRTRMI